MSEHESAYGPYRRSVYRGGLDPQWSGEHWNEYFDFCRILAERVSAIRLCSHNLGRRFVHSRS